jgi:hypothetical protein
MDRELTVQEVREAAIATLRELLAAAPVHANEAVSVFEARLRTWRHGKSSIVVSPDSRWIRMPSGVMIQLKPYWACRMIVTALVERRVAAPGEAMSRADLVALLSRGSLKAEASFRTAMKRLRHAGFCEILVALQAGYLINPSFVVVRALHSAVSRAASWEAFGATCVTAADTLHIPDA